MTVLLLEYSRVLSEVDVILNQFPSELLEKIPSNLLNTIKENKHKSYMFNYDKNKSLIEQKISEKAKDLISAIYLRYICGEEEKKELIEICKQNDFKNKEKNILDTRVTKKVEIKNEVCDDVKKTEENNSLVVEEKWYKRFINLIKKIFRFKK